MYKRNTKGHRGFTLIELLVVIAIIGILSSVVLASLNTARQKARDARRISDIKNLQLALELSADDHGGNYPAALADLVTDGYISVVPLDPSDDSAPLYGSNNSTQYHLAFDLENSANLPDNDAGCSSVAPLVCFAAPLTNGFVDTPANGRAARYDQTD